MNDSIPEQNSINTELATHRKPISVISVISIISLLLPLGLLGLAIFFPGNKQDFMKSCINTQQLVQSSQTKDPVDINRIKQLKADICENTIWKNEVSSHISWSWNLFFVVLPIVSTIILAVETDPKIKAVCVAISSASTVLVSSTAVDQWYEFQNNLASEGRVLVFKLNYEVSSNQDLEKIVEEYHALILCSSVGQPSTKSNPSPSSNSSPGSS